MTYSNGAVAMEATLMGGHSKKKPSNGERLRSSVKKSANGASASAHRVIASCQHRAHLAATMRTSVFCTSSEVAVCAARAAGALARHNEDRVTR